MCCCSFIWGFPENSIKWILKEFNLTNKKIDALVRVKTNQQLNQYSNIYFNKIKKDLIINEL